MLWVLLTALLASPAATATSAAEQESDLSSDDECGSESCALQTLQLRATRSAEEVTKQVWELPANSPNSSNSSRSGWHFDFHLEKTVTLSGLHDDIFSDIGEALKQVVDKSLECLDKTIQVHFAMWLRFVLDPQHCAVEASVNSGSAKLRASLCGELPVSVTLLSGPAVKYDTLGVTFTQCAHDVVCLDLRFDNKGGCDFNLWDVRTRASVQQPLPMRTGWVPVLWDVKLS
eukprot:TRINITY_DN55079_c0_g1_i1.p1 TRINITY_DN55079_c0_g1~~TRINITY_DN55079_c0_g1_i1.p1  ORF type:complete len:242 (-),score=45.18 TRINITY_DN55079_c0_g1_i1:78-770(-)